jgi:hypothetical protein
MGKTKRIRRRAGDIVRIPLNDGFHSYARVLDEPLVAFYNIKTKRNLSPQEIVGLPLLFRVWVMNHAITSGRWPIIGNYPLTPSESEPPKLFKQDGLKPSSFSIYVQGTERPATKAECVGLERAAVWDPEHVEDRLRDFYAGRPNKWVESLKIKD